MNMIITHKAAVAEFGSPYRINKEIKANRLFRVARGFYSDTRYADPYALCAMRYPGAIVTMDSAFYLHGLTDRVPDKVHLATATLAWSSVSPRTGCSILAKPSSSAMARRYRSTVASAC